MDFLESKLLILKRGQEYKKFFSSTYVETEYNKSILIKEETININKNIIGTILVPLLYFFDFSLKQNYNSSVLIKEESISIEKSFESSLESLIKRQYIRNFLLNNKFNKTILIKEDQININKNINSKPFLYNVKFIIFSRTIIKEFTKEVYIKEENLSVDKKINAISNIITNNYIRVMVSTNYNYSKNVLIKDEQLQVSKIINSFPIVKRYNYYASDLETLNNFNKSISIKEEKIEINKEVNSFPIVKRYNYYASDLETLSIYNKSTLIKEEQIQINKNLNSEILMYGVPYKTFRKTFIENYTKNVLIKDEKININKNIIGKPITILKAKLPNRQDVGQGVIKDFNGIYTQTGYIRNEPILLIINLQGTQVANVEFRYLYGDQILYKDLAAIGSFRNNQVFFDIQASITANISFVEEYYGYIIIENNINLNNLYIEVDNRSGIRTVLGNSTIRINDNLEMVITWNEPQQPYPEFTWHYLEPMPKTTFCMAGYENLIGKECEIENQEIIVAGFDIGYADGCHKLICKK